MVIDMKIKFLGGAEEVGRLAIKVEDGNQRFMVDYGMIPDKPPKYPMPPEPVDGLFLTHAHLDHTGMVPHYFSKFSANFYATMMTANSIKPLLDDALKVARLENYPRYFSAEDIDSVFSSLIPVNYGEYNEFGSMGFTPYSAGHIPGSTMWHFQNSRSLLVTGDLNTKDTLLLDGAKPVRSDVLIMESTYAGKNHEERSSVVKRLRESVKEVVDQGGKVILPSFAVGRTQELIMALSDLNLSIGVDGLGNSLTSIYLHTPGYFRSHRDLRRAVSRTRSVRNARMRESALENDVIITTSGMLDGGPVLNYIRKLADDDKSAIFLTGYQVEGTNGRSLMENGTLTIDGKPMKPKQRIEFFDMSAHAGHDELVSFVKEVSPETVILCHGENREKLLADLSEFEVILPMNGNEFTV